jgi:hypothetical protein
MGCDSGLLLLKMLVEQLTVVPLRRSEGLQLSAPAVQASERFHDARGRVRSLCRDAGCQGL